MVSCVVLPESVQDGTKIKQFDEILEDVRRVVADEGCGEG